jgi:hypothetical protein
LTHGDAFGLGQRLDIDIDLSSEVRRNSGLTLAAMASSRAERSEVFSRRANSPAVANAAISSAENPMTLVSSALLRMR